MHPLTVTFKSSAAVRLIVQLEIAFIVTQLCAATLPPSTQTFLENRCYDCHDADTKKGDLDLTALKLDPADAANFAHWVKMHDRVRDGEMPPKKKAQPERKERAAFLAAIEQPLAAADRERQAKNGRVVYRRLNRTEYEYTLRDLFELPHLDVREILPADGEAHGFDTVGEALNLSYVQVAKYLEAADVALDEAIALEREAPKSETVLKPFSEIGRFKRENGEVPPLGAARVILRQPNSAQGPWDLPPFVAKVGGMYRLRLSCYGLFWDNGTVKPADRPHVASLYATENKVTRLLKTFDAPNDKSGTLETVVWLNAGESLIVHADSLDDRNEPIANKKRGLPYSGPGIALVSFETQGPLPAEWPPRSHSLLFGDLPVVEWTAASGLREPAPRESVRKSGNKSPTPMMVVPKDPERDAERLLRQFMERTFRHPVAAEELNRYLALVKERLAQKFVFNEALRTGYKAILCSPDFLFFHEKPGRLDDHALASRLSYFLWKSEPDETLRNLAKQGGLSNPAVLRDQTERLLNDPKSERFVVDFLDQWLELRRIAFTEPDKQLYPEFKSLTQDSMIAETRAFFAAMLREDLSADHLVRSDFVFANAPLAELYDLPDVKGFELRKVSLPKNNPRGGFLTQASVLKVTANGTTTSPVTRGAWVMERLLGKPVPPPPPGAGSIDPDVRGTTTIREQLDKHRADASCAACHQKIDPPGFALESFDVMGGWRERYRSLEKGDLAKRIVKDKPVGYKLGPPVDASGQTADGKSFQDIHEFRELLLRDPDQLARNLTERLIVYATGAGVSFADREEVERIIAASAKSNHGLRTLVHEVVQSSTFQSK